MHPRPADDAKERVCGDVVVYAGGTGARAQHEYTTCREIARRLAAIKRYRFAGEHDGRENRASPRYFVPLDTLVGIEQAHALGIESEHDLFGGVVPHPFVATKCISHPLVDDGARAPDGWSAAFADRVAPAVLRGFAAFAVTDALRAAERLFAYGPVRIKRALGIGGLGQVVVHDRRALEQVLADADADEISRYGIAVEQDLVDVTTYSVGQVRVDDLLVSYCGTQCLTENNAGHHVYGGSDLLVARGDFAALLALVDDTALRRAIEQARVYDAAAFECFAGLFASRRNYDVAHGLAADRQPCAGVLEQSWRIGGASGAEVGALAAFRADPALTAVRASSTERYGREASPPPGASVYFHGTDERVGPFVKYAVTKPHAYA